MPVTDLHRRSGWALGAAVALAAVATAWWAPVATSMPNTVVIPIAKPHPGGFPARAAIFDHSSHQQFVCYACHPTLFPRYLLGFTHAQMNEGLYCGGCHDGRAASAITGQTCETCHVAP
jgi:c(7)-type cytochrome triheme protein